MLLVETGKRLVADRDSANAERDMLKATLDTALADKAALQEQVQAQAQAQVQVQAQAQAQAQTQAHEQAHEHALTRSLSGITISNNVFSLSSPRFNTAYDHTHFLEQLHDPLRVGLPTMRTYLKFIYQDAVTCLTGVPLTEELRKKVHERIMTSLKYYNIKMYLVITDIMYGTLGDARGLRLKFGCRSYRKCACGNIVVVVPRRLNDEEEAMFLQSFGDRFDQPLGKQCSPKANPGAGAGANPGAKKSRRGKEGLEKEEEKKRGRGTREGERSEERVVEEAENEEEEGEGEGED